MKLVVLFFFKNYVTYREFLLYLEEYQKTKLTELKKRRNYQKSINSPRNDYTFTMSKGPNNFVQSSGIFIIYRIEESKDTKDRKSVVI